MACASVSLASLSLLVGLSALPFSFCISVLYPHSMRPGYDRVADGQNGGASVVAANDGDMIMFEPNMAYAPNARSLRVTHENNLSPGRKKDTFDCKTDYLLLFTQGKTGSTSFASSVEKMCGFYASYTTEVNTTYPQAIKTHGNSWRVAQDFLNKIPVGQRVWVITLVRNPFAQSMSSFFQEVDGTTNAALDYRKYMQCLDGDRFFKYFKMVTDVSVDDLAREYSKQGKYSLVKKHYKHLSMYTLLLREEDIVEWSEVLAGVMPNFKVEVENIGNTKVYATTYADLKESFKYTKDEVQCFLESPNLQFYSSSEVAAMLKALPG